MRCISLCLVVCVSVGVCAQETGPPPKQLLDAGHCLAVAQEDWLGVARDKPYELELGYYAPETKTVGADNLLYVVDYDTPTHSDGKAFAFLIQGKEAHRVLRLQFHTGFRQSVDGSQHVELVDPELGGIGTEDAILAAIKQIGFHTYTVPVADLVNRPVAARCESAGSQ